MRKGSVMMEFLLVVPIYLALLGGTFIVGDMLIRSIKLAHADRLWAMSRDEFGAETDLALADLFPNFVFDYEDKMMSVPNDTLQPFGKTHRADDDFEWAWTLQMAGRVGDDYHHPPWSRGLFAFASDTWDDTVKHLEKKVAYKARTMADKMADTVRIFAMERNVRLYDYYTLKRSALARGSKSSKNPHFRYWKPENLTNVPIDYGRLAVSDLIPVWGATWFSKVYAEPFAETNPAELDKSLQDPPGSLPDQPTWRTEYNRFPSFLLWSQ